MKMTKQAFAKLLFNYSEMNTVFNGRHFNITDPSGNEHWFSISREDIAVEAQDGDVEAMLQAEVCAWDPDQVVDREGWQFEEIFLE